MGNHNPYVTMLCLALVCVSIKFLGCDAHPGHLDTLLEKYKSAGYFPGPVIQSAPLSVMFQCYELCRYFPGCTSISYNLRRHQCHLHNTTGTVLPDQNWVHIKFILGVGEKGCSSNSCPEKLCVPLSAQGHFCVAAKLAGKKSIDITVKNTAQGTSSTHDVAEYPETTLNAAFSIETSLSDTSTLQMDTGQYLTQSSDIQSRNTESMTPTMTLTYNQVDKLERMVTSFVEIKATSPSALTLTYHGMEIASTAINTDTSTSVDTPVTTIFDHTSADDDHTPTEDGVVTALSLVVSNTDLAKEDASVAIVSRSFTTTTETTSPLTDEFTTTLSPEMLKRKIFLKRHYRYLTKCINTFAMPFEETRTCTDKKKVRRDGGPCACRTGLYLNKETMACRKKCMRYGYGMVYQSRLFCIDGHNDRVLDAHGNIMACAKACFAEAAFVCRSFDYYMGTCFLSRHTRATVSPAYWLPYCGCKYYQRTCAV